MARKWIDFLNKHKISDKAYLIAEIAHKQAFKRRYCYPNWKSVENESLLSQDDFMQAFDELCEYGIVNNGFPSILVYFSEDFCIAPMFGPVKRTRPTSEIWKKIRESVFKRDDYTCQYCGERGGKLECDHINPVTQGGSNDNENLTTACFYCNRSKHTKTLSQWLGDK
jgi:hypothetical protein